MPKSVVALVKCTDYEERRVYGAVERGIELLGGVRQFVRPGDRLVLKPNILIGAAPERCVTTHPSVFGAVGNILKEAGATISYGDSPAFGGMEINARPAGLKRMADESGFTPADFDHGREVSHKSALLNKKFVIARGALDADGLISLPKLKTQGFTKITGAVKNQFGCIPGVLKGQFHAKIADPFLFGTMLVDINTLLKPRLFIMDAVTAMEGNGPRNGKPRQMNVLLFSRDPVALDSIACKMIGLDPEFVPTSKPGEQSGLGTYHYENIEVVGDAVEDFACPDFDIVREPPVSATAGRMRRLIRDRTTPRPLIDRARCNGCGTCVKMCPVGKTALDWALNESAKVPKHNYNHCIRCYCCQEMCPQGAITIRRPALSRLLPH